MRRYCSELVERYFGIKLAGTLQLVIHAKRLSITAEMEDAMPSLTFGGSLLPDLPNPFQTATQSQTKDGELIQTTTAQSGDVVAADVKRVEDVEWFKSILRLEQAILYHLSVCPNAPNRPLLIYIYTLIQSYKLFPVWGHLLNSPK